MDLLQPTMVAALLIAGMGVALLGSLKVQLARRLNIDEARVGGLVSLFGFVMIPVILTAGFLTDQAGANAGGSFDKPLVLSGGCFLFAISLLLLSRSRTYGVALIAVILISASWAIIVNVGNVLTPSAFGGSPAFAFNLANVFFGLGAFLTPMTIAFLIGRSSFPVAVISLAGVCLIPALLALGSSDVASVAVGHDPGLTAVLTNPMLWLCGFALFFYGPLEASLAAWTTTYLGDQGIREETAARLLSGFWLAFMAGRLLTALFLPDGYSRLLILVLGCLGFVLLSAMVMCRSRTVAAALALSAGFLFGPIFPTLIAVLLGSFPPAVHGRAVGFFFAVGGVGWTLVPMLIGFYAKRTSVQRSFVIAAGAAVGLSAIALAILLRSL